MLKYDISIIDTFSATMEHKKTIFENMFDCIFSSMFAKRTTILKVI
jgi:hypothetical protein